MLCDILHLVFKYKAVVILIFVLVMAAGTVCTLLMKPIYEASAKVLVLVGREDLSGGQQAALNPVMYDTSKDERINSEMEILRSRHLVEHVLKDMGIIHIFPSIAKKKSFPLLPFHRSLTPFERAVLLVSKKHLRVRRIAGSYIIVIGFAHENPVIAAEFVNRFVNVYLRHHQSVYSRLSGYGLPGGQAGVPGKREDVGAPNAPAGRTTAHVSIVEEALLPIEPVSPILWLNLLLSGIVGAVVSVGSVLIISSFSHYFRNAEDIRNHLNLPVLATIPEIKRSPLHKVRK